ncbi:MAG: protease inhibitor I42 family protein [Methanomassiliicoccus sp.]|nr:protease inhibitor I42 family protein [Methanomassiliicoccus sp.]
MNIIIVAELGREFTIALEANPTTGYSWKAEYDDQRFDLVGQEYVRNSNHMGGGGRTDLTFRPLKRGKANIRLRYMRPWEKEAVEIREYRIRVP